MNVPYKNNINHYRFNNEPILDHMLYDLSSDRNTNRSRDSILEKLDIKHSNTSNSSHIHEINSNKESVINFTNTYTPMILEKVRINQDMIA